MRFDHHHEVGQAGDDPIAGRKTPGLGTGTQRRLAQQQADLGHPVPQPRATAGVHDIESAAHHRHRCRGPCRRGHGQGPLVGRVVDAAGQAGDDGDAGLGQLRGPGTSQLEPVGRRPAGSDDGHGGGSQRQRISTSEQQGRRLGILLQPQGITRRAPHQQLHAVTLVAVKQLTGFDGPSRHEPTRQQLLPVPPQLGPGQIRMIGMAPSQQFPSGLGRAGRRYQLVQAVGPHRRQDQQRRHVGPLRSWRWGVQAPHCSAPSSTSQSTRRCMAKLRCSSPSTVVDSPARSARVRATRRTRSTPRAVSRC